MFSIFYNDEHPDHKLDGYRAHMKGFMAFDDNQGGIGKNICSILLHRFAGFWLIHSVPRLMDSTKPYEYPETGTKFGQSILCVTYPTTALEEICKLLGRS